MNVARIIDVAGRGVGAMLLFALTLFCGFGFLASFEYPGITVWHVSYATLGLTFLSMIVVVLRPLFRRPRLQG